jgi:hypothetical protein
VPAQTDGAAIAMTPSPAVADDLSPLQWVLAVLLYLGPGSVGLFWGLFFTLHGAHRSLGTDIQPVEAMRWSWLGARKGAWRGGVVGAIVGMLGGLAVFLLITVIFQSIRGFLDELFFTLGRAPTPETVEWSLMWQLVLSSTVGCLVAGLSFGAACGGIVGEVKESKAYPNEGMWLGVRNAALGAGVIGLGGYVVCSLSTALVLLLIGEELESAAITGLLGGLVSAVVAAPLGGLCYGGYDVAKHCVLRLLLYITGATPFRLKQTLDSACDLVFLRRTGGAYMFVHRLLMEHFGQE